jgi:N-methylhydantoinase A
MEGFTGPTLQISRFADMRYLGQSYELSLPFPSGKISPEIISCLKNDFHLSHERAYEYARIGEKIEFVNLRLVALGKLPQSEIAGDWPSQGTPATPSDYRQVLFDGQEYKTPIYNRQHLLQGQPLCGPVVIEQLDSTTVIPPGYRVSVEHGGNIIIEPEEA